MRTGSNQQLTQMCDYLNERLRQIQNYIVNHKLQKQRVSLLQQKIDHLGNNLIKINDKIKWIQIITKDNQVIFSKIQDKINKITQKYERLYNNQTKYCLFQDINKKFINKTDVVGLIKQTADTLISNALDTIFEVRIQHIQNQINQIKFGKKHNNEYNSIDNLYQTNPIASQIVVTKTQLQQSLQLLHQIINEEIIKMQKQMKKLKKNRKKRSIVKQILKSDQSFKQKSNKKEFNDYDITSKFINEYRQQNSHSDSSSSIKLKPLIFNKKKNIQKLKIQNQTSLKKRNQQFYRGSKKSSKQKDNQTSTKPKNKNYRPQFREQEKTKFKLYHGQSARKGSAIQRKKFKSI